MVKPLSSPSGWLFYHQQSISKVMAKAILHKKALNLKGFKQVCNSNAVVPIHKRV